MKGNGTENKRDQLLMTNPYMSLQNEKDNKQLLEELTGKLNKSEMESVEKCKK